MPIQDPTAVNVEIVETFSNSTASQFGVPYFDRTSPCDKGYHCWQPWSQSVADNTNLGDWCMRFRLDGLQDFGQFITDIDFVFDLQITWTNTAITSGWIAANVMNTDAYLENSAAADFIVTDPSVAPEMTTDMTTNPAGTLTTSNKPTATNNAHSTWTVLDRLWGIYAVKSWEILQGGLTKQKVHDCDYERLCVGLFNDTLSFEERLMELNNKSMPTFYTQSSEITGYLIPPEPPYKTRTNYSKISNLFLATNPGVPYLYACERKLPFWGSMRTEQAVPIQICHPARLWEIEIVMNDPSYYVKTWDYASANGINFKIVNPHIRVTYATIPQRTFNANFPMGKSITYQFPDYQREKYTLTVPSALSPGGGPYSHPLQYINGATRTLLVMIRNYDALYGVNQTTGSMTNYKDHDSYMCKKGQSQDILNLYFSFNSQPLFFSNSNSRQLSANDQLFYIRRDYFKKNLEDTVPVGSMAGGDDIISNVWTRETQKQFPWFIWTFGTNGDINKPGYGIRDLSTYPPMNLVLNIEFGKDFVPRQTPVPGSTTVPPATTPAQYQVDVFAFTENFISLDRGEFFLLKLQHA